MRHLGRLSKEETAKLFQAYAETVETSVDTFSKAAKVLGEEGLWIALEIDLFLVTGEVPRTNEILWAQRVAIAELWRKNGFLALMSRDFKLPFTDVGLPNPLKPFIGLLFAYGTKMRATKFIEVPETREGPVHALFIAGATRRVEAYVALEPLDRAFIALVLPGVCRVLLKFMGNIFELG